MNENLNILIIGQGGREHALAWKAAQSRLVKQVFVAPGNGGTAVEPTSNNVPISNIPISVVEIEKLKEFAITQKIDLTIVGPEVPLVAGIVDVFQAAGLKIFGPCQKGAQLEGSKAFCKDFFQKYQIPTASYQHFTDIEKAKAYVLEKGTPIVIKADGLAAGKGVVIAHTQEHAMLTIEDMLANNRFGDAGSRVIIETFLEGEEASYMVMVDGLDYLPLASSQDHKARDDHDKGPNTGGMGAYSPAPVVTKEIEDKIRKTVIEPTLKGLQAEGIYYQGFLYAGVMITKNQDIYVLEYNCRMGDPETQPIMMRLESDLVELCLNTLNHQLKTTVCHWKNEFALGVVLAAKGYPDAYSKDMTISISHPQISATPDKDIGTTRASDKIFHAGTYQEANTLKIKSNGGRVLCAVSLGKTIQNAQQNAYQLLDTVEMENGFFRKDIGHRAILK